MTNILRWARSGRREHLVREVQDRGCAGGPVAGDRLFAGLRAGAARAGAFGQSHWWVSTTSGEGPSLICHSRAGLGDATFALGPAAGVGALLSLHPGAYQTFATVKPEHVAALEPMFALRTPRTMVRMHVRRETFRRVEGEAVLLRASQARALNRLYSSEGGATAYQPRHLSEGRYYGVVEGGRLLAVAGTHAISPRYGIAVVGNVFTHPAHRGRGLATQATSVVTAALLADHEDVVLSVDPGNVTAITAYRRLGYADAGEIVEAAARRRMGSLATGLRRLLASYRGRQEGVEVVRR